MRRPNLAAVARWPDMTPRARAAVATMIAATVTLLASLVHIGIDWATALPDDAVLQLDDTVVTEDEFEHRVDALSALYGVKRPEGGAEADRFRRDAAKAIAVSMILDRAASQRDVVIADKAAQDALGKIIEDQLNDNRSGFVQFLSTQGLAERDVLDEVKRQLATSRLFSEVTSDLGEVTDKEVRQTFEKRRDEMVVPERRHLRNIVVDTREKASDILAELDSGADFAVLAAESSMDGSTRDKGGDLGTLAADQLDKGFAKAAFGASEGSTFGPVKTKHGWNVGYVQSVKTEQQLSFEQVSDRLKTELTQQRKLEKWRSWLGDLIEAAEVEYVDEYRPADPDAPPETTQPAGAPR
ncbi:peptidyl-prolyl cis-trans isomerase [Haloechinothrix salitolerans]|uniref:peptidylprolyl isomerase n=1 Tax=Haloechinothrix salitolerans TaxID=926830 RepID=A0ABW2C1K1_9PSEU